MSEAINSPEAKSRRFRPYPKYKASGVEWLGEIPAHWEVKPLKHAAALAMDRIDVNELEIPHLGLEHVESRTGKMVRAAEYGSSEEQVAEGLDTRFRSGDVLFGKLRPYLAKVLLSSFDGRCSSELLVLRPKGEISPAFLAYQLLSPGFIAWINAMTYGTKMPRASPDQIMGTPIAIPDSDEQNAISTFLDRETGKIDALIEKKERLIELLQEKRTALITQAVTKGLDPNVPMKDSGIEWLGKIPKHWEVKRLKNLSSINDEALNEKTDPRFELIYVDIGGVDQFQGIIEREELVFENAPSRARRIVRDGDVIISTVRTYLRAIAPINKPMSNLIVSTGFAVIRPSSSLESNFAPYALRASHFIESVVANSVGVSYPAIDTSKMSCFLIATPNIEEQQEIASFLDRETAIIDALVAKIHEAIDRLKEYRTAVISATVTGKIDVWELA